MINASLGAHYSTHFVLTSVGLWWQTLLGFSSPRASGRLKAKLEKLFGGSAVLVYKGRDAIELVLRAYGLTDPSAVVLTQAFTCFAIEEAIVRAGATPHYADLGKGQLNLTVKTLEQAYSQIKKPNTVKAVIVQHSLGHPAEIEQIRQWCDKHQLLLIEDLAQSFGAKVNGKLLGGFGDAVVLSFGRDKIIDAVSGGATIFRRQPKQLITDLPLTPKSIVLKDLTYPFLTWFIRSTYDVLIGKLLHKFLTLVKVMGNPTSSPTNTITALPESLARLALIQLELWPAVHRIRQVTATMYLEKLIHTPLQLVTDLPDLKNGALLRVAVTTASPSALLTFLKVHNIHLTDRWYRLPVDCGALNCETQYLAGSCPNAELMAATIINLPTHAKVSFNDAEKIISLIKKYCQNENK